MWEKITDWIDDHEVLMAITIGLVVYCGILALALFAGNHYKQKCNQEYEGVTRYHSARYGGFDYICRDGKWVPKK